MHLSFISFNKVHDNLTMTIMDFIKADSGTEVAAREQNNSDYTVYVKAILVYKIW